MSGKGKNKGGASPAKQDAKPQTPAKAAAPEESTKNAPASPAAEPAPTPVPAAEAKAGEAKAADGKAVDVSKQVAEKLQGIPAWVATAFDKCVSAISGLHVTQLCRADLIALTHKLLQTLRLSLAQAARKGSDSKKAKKNAKKKAAAAAAGGAAPAGGAKEISPEILLRVLAEILPSGLFEVCESVLDEIKDAQEFADKPASVSYFCNGCEDSIDVIRFTCPNGDESYDLCQQCEGVYTEVQRRKKLQANKKKGADNKKKGKKPKAQEEEDDDEEELAMLEEYAAKIKPPGPLKKVVDLSWPLAETTEFFNAAAMGKDGEGVLFQNRVHPQLALVLEVSISELLQLGARIAMSGMESKEELKANMEEEGDEDEEAEEEDEEDEDAEASEEEEPDMNEKNIRRRYVGKLPSTKGMQEVPNDEQESGAGKKAGKAKGRIEEEEEEDEEEEEPAPRKKKSSKGKKIVEVDDDGNVIDDDDETPVVPVSKKHTAAHGHTHGGAPCHGHGGGSHGHSHAHGGHGHAHGGHGHAHGGKKHRDEEEEEEEEDDENDEDFEDEEEDVEDLELGEDEDEDEEDEDGQPDVTVSAKHMSLAVQLDEDMEGLLKRLQISNFEESDPEHIKGGRKSEEEAPVPQFNWDFNYSATAAASASGAAGTTASAPAIGAPATTSAAPAAGGFNFDFSAFKFDPAAGSGSSAAPAASTAAPAAPAGGFSFNFGAAAPAASGAAPAAAAPAFNFSVPPTTANFSFSAGVDPAANKDEDDEEEEAPKDKAKSKRSQRMGKHRPY